MAQRVYFCFEFWPIGDVNLSYEVVKPAIQSVQARLLAALQANGPAGLVENKFTTSDNTVIVMVTGAGNGLVS